MHPIFHFAYLDPGTGSLIIQSVIGAVAGVIVFGRQTLLNIKHKLTRSSATPKAGVADKKTDEIAK